MANEFVARNGLIAQNNSTVTGSLTVTSGITGSLEGTSSWANNAVSASYISSSNISGTVLSASYASTASYAPDYVLNNQSGSFLVTSSFNNFTSSVVTTSSFNSYTSSVVTTSSFDTFTSSVVTTSSFDTFTSSVVTTSSFNSYTSSVVTTLSFNNYTSSVVTTSSFNTYTSSLNAYTSSVVTTSSFNNYTGSTTSQFAGTASYVSGNVFTSTNPALSASYAQTSSFALSASYAPITSAFPYVGSATVTGSLLVLGTGSIAFTAFTTSSITSQSFFLVAGTIRNSGSLSSSVYGVNISPTLQYITASTQTATALRVAPTFLSGSTAVSNSILNVIADLGTTGVGSQFVVNDITSGSVYQINTTSGLPLVDMSSDWVYKIYSYPTVIFQTSGSAVTISGSLKVSGSLDAQVLSSSYAFNATTASYALNGGGGGSGTGFPFSGSGVVTGSLLISGAIPTEGLIVSGPIDSTGTITAPTFAGTLSGNASSATTATNATNVGITDTTTGGTHYITFVSANSSNQIVRVDSTGLLYTPSTEQLRVVGGVTSSFTGSLTGALIGTSSWAVSASQALTASYYGGALTSGVPQGPDGTYQFKQGGTNLSGSTTLTFLNDIDGIIATGSFTGSFKGPLTGPLTGTSSWAVSASYVTGSIFNSNNRALTASFAITASYVTGSVFGSTNPVISASYALTASYIPPEQIQAVGSVVGSGAGIGVSATGPGGTGTVTISNTGVVGLQNGTSIEIQSMGGGIYKINAGGTFQTNGQTLAIISGVSNLF